MCHRFRNLEASGVYHIPLLRRLVDDFILASEGEIKNAARLYIEQTHNLAEGAWAALAGVIKLDAGLAGKRVGVILSDGNVSPCQLSEALGFRSR